MLTLGDRYTGVHFTILGNFVYVHLKFPMLRVKMDEVFRNAVHGCLITEYQKENLTMWKSELLSYILLILYVFYQKQLAPKMGAVHSLYTDPLVK